MSLGVVHPRDAERDWVVDLRTPRGVRHRIGVSAVADRQRAISAAFLHVWKVRQSFGEFMDKATLIRAARRNGSEV